MSLRDFAGFQYIVSGVLFVIYCSLLLIEQRHPLRKRTRPLLPRMLINFSLSVLVFATASVFISPLVKWTLHLTSSYEFGVLQLLPDNFFIVFVCGFLLMDLSFYYWHRMNHEFPWLWRFHNVHHADPDLDVTTSMRFHIVEIAYSSLFRLVQLSLIGINPLTFFCYEFVFQVSTFFQHSNIRLPIRFERLINKIVVTPRMHGIHHSDYRDETNQNYAVVFSFWDRWHRTLKLNVPQQEIAIGVPAYSKETNISLSDLLLMPIKPQRPYWQLGTEQHYSRDHQNLDADKTYLVE